MEEHNWIKTILTPLSWIYGSVTSVRNRLYDQHIFLSQKPEQFTISIGNLTVGGTGKTPMTEYLVRMLQPDFHLAILSRGYGRKTKGFLLAGSQSTAEDIGDEPLQYFQKYGKKVAVAVCEKRVEGAKQLADLRPDNNLLLLDDAFQHRAIKQDIKILLNDYNRPFYNDLPFPAGRLRENRNGALRADAIVVTKSPTDLPESDRKKIIEKIRKYSNPKAPVFFSSIRYAQPVDYSGSEVTLKNVKLVAGIANPQTFITHLSQHFNVIEEIIFPDHYNYTSADLERLIKYLKNDTFVVTTEKDMVKLKPLVEKSGLATQFAYIPIAVDFGKDTGPFSEWLKNRLP
ncbi:tetraacyldisaccharide 4'-kinase [Dyadobacter psychrotolerans]|uniref:Tetraacyldisaccharide 4'-kinase n=1 Tax=Dyadobacter psychrotolerans TaxID=2541721 RepID=A0A4R5E0Q7_9BACT|nr:tetraacyldisaccharide 4'-kinase [Dyadobacter psychrotolerans]TDE18141.1 tetraacyldisaccharide 4'-kinase [Dyadobacter psychrotolerans]